MTVTRWWISLMLKDMVRRVRMIKLSPKMCALNDFVQSMACCRAEMQILGQITSGSKLWLELVGDKCITQEWSKPVSLQLQVQGHAGGQLQGEKLFISSFHLPSAHCTLPSPHLATCIFSHRYCYRKCNIFNLWFWSNFWSPIFHISWGF